MQVTNNTSTQATYTGKTSSSSDTKEYLSSLKEKYPDVNINIVSSNVLISN